MSFYFKTKAQSKDFALAFTNVSVSIVQIFPLCLVFITVYISVLLYESISNKEFRLQICQTTKLLQQRFKTQLNYL